MAYDPNKPKPDAGVVDVPLTASFNLIAPRPVAILSTMRHGDDVVPEQAFLNMKGFSYDRRADYDAAPMSTLTLLSKRPPVHTIAITRSRKSYANIVATGEAVANFFLTTQEYVERLYLLSDGNYRTGNAKLRDSGLLLQDSRMLKVPILCEAAAWIEYKLVQIIDVPGSERPIIILKPIASYSREAVLDSRVFVYRNATDYPMGHLGSNVFSGGAEGRYVARHMSRGKELTLEQHWDYSDGKPFLSSK